MLKKNEIKSSDLRDAVLAYWLRTGYDASAEDIAKQLRARIGTIRAALKRESSGPSSFAHIPGCTTHYGQSRGRGLGSSPTTWRPDTGFLRAIIRGEGIGTHDWIVRGDVIFKGHGSFGPRTRIYRIHAPTQKEAIQAAIELAEREGGKIHPNSRWSAEWLGKREPIQEDLAELG